MCVSISIVMDGSSIGGGLDLNVEVIDSNPGRPPLGKIHIPNYLRSLIYPAKMNIFSCPHDYHTLKTVLIFA